ncbi:MAG: kynureninase, partial [Alphaproteobacteria bacterium]|nr:kynureninase [Alphaproteobacteria bacterium]
KRHHANAEQPLTGWFGHKRPFDFIDDYEPAPDIRRMLVGTTSVLAASALDSALDAFKGVDMGLVRKKSQAMTDLFIALTREKLMEYGVGLATSENPAKRGSHVSLTCENGYAVVQALIEQGVIGDFRAPNFMRFGFTPLYLGFEDVYRAVEIMADIFETGVWKETRFSEKGAVT